MSKRTSIFAAPAPVPAGPLDVSDFAPKPQPDARPRQEDIDAAHVGSRFQSREAGVPSVDKTSSKRLPMVYRTGRNVTFSAKTTRQTVDQFYAIAERNGWKAGETFEKAVAALMAETGDSGSSDDGGR